MKFVNLIRNSYEGFSCRVVHEGKLTQKFDVKTGVRQECLLSLFLFILAIDWIMRAVTNRKRNGIQWTLDDLDFADDLALRSHKHQQIQAKTSDLHHTSVQIGLTINKQKTKILRINAGTDELFTILKGKNWQGKNLGSVMDESREQTQMEKLGSARHDQHTTC